MNLKIILYQLFPGLGILKRYLYALKDTLMPEKYSYAQHREDEFVRNYFKSQPEKPSIFYVDIGANHPTTISNTYKFYRNGSFGITIEPFDELYQLHRKFRPRDISLQVGCAEENKISEIYISKTPVLSSLNQKEVASIWKKSYISVFTLDTIIHSLNIQHIDFLSIDVEGLDFQVLIGAQDSLNITKLICIEANNDKEEYLIKDFLGKQKFIFLEKFSCNLFFENTRNFNV